MVLQTSLLPFDHKFETKQVKEGQTLQEIYNDVGPRSFNDCSILMSLNGVVIPADEWSNHTINEKDVVCLNVVPTGGGSSGKSILTMVAFVAAAFFVPYLAASAGSWAGVAFGSYGAGGMGPVLFSGTASMIAQGSVYVASSLLLSIASNALMSTPTQSTYTEQGKGYIYGANNTIDRFGVLPINLGTNRVFPNQCANPYTETENKVYNYVRQMFTFGYGKVVISEEKLGDTLLTEYTDYETNYRLNGDLIEGVELYTQDVQQTGYNVRLETNEPVVRTTGSDVNEAIVDIAFQSGLYAIYSSKQIERTDTVEFLISYAVSESEEWTEPELFSVTDFKKEPLVVSKRLVFPQAGKYDIRIMRITEDEPFQNGNSTTADDADLISIKTVTYQNPINQKDISGVAIRMKATDQLSGTIDTYNAICSTLVKGYNPETDTWDDDVISSNPADLFRYVLQSPANVKRVGDELIDLEKLKEWWLYCNEKNLSYNRYIDYEASVEEILTDIAAAGVATKTKHHNVYSVVIDNEREFVKGIITPRNSWDYKGTLVYVDLPDALRIEFRNKDEGYENDERIVYRDGYDETNSELYERLQFNSCTNADLAYWYGRRYIATAELQPESHSWQMDFENLTFNRGDRVQLISDAILVGAGQGRIREIFINAEGNVTGFRIDDTLNLPTVNNLGCRIRHNNGQIPYYSLSSSTGMQHTFFFSQPVDKSVNISLDNLVAFVEDSKELDLIVTEIKPGTNLTATITAVDYAPARFDPISAIPEWESNITITPDLYRPIAPRLNGDIISDESVMIKNTDGSYTSLMSIPLLNGNTYDVTPSIMYRVVGATQWSKPTMLKVDSNEVQITGLSDGKFYDFQIRYQNKFNQQLYSAPLQLNSVKFVGGSTRPADVQGFKVLDTNGIGLFEWTPNTDIDLAYYRIKFVDKIEDVVWETAQVLVDKIIGNSITLPILQGTYLIKAVDYLENESVNSNTIVSTEQGGFPNVIENLVQEPDWLGVMDGTRLDNLGNLILNQNVNEGYYYFNPDELDLGENFECSLMYNLEAELRDEPESDVSIRSVTNIREIPNIRQLISAEWSVNIEMNLSTDGITWTDWQPFTAARHTFRFAKFRLYLKTDNDFTTPTVLRASIRVDMPDRYEVGEDVVILNADEGHTIVYSSAFRNNPGVNVTLQDGQEGDTIEFTNKNSKGFTIKVKNGINYVNRSFDYISAGYGKVK